MDILHLEFGKLSFDYKIFNYANAITRTNVEQHSVQSMSPGSLNNREFCMNHKVGARHFLTENVTVA